MTAVINFQTTSPVSQQNSTREKSADRQKRIAALLVKATFLGVLGMDNATKLTEGKTIALPNGKAVSLTQPESLKCAACGGVNGLRDKNAELLAMQAAWNTADGKLVFLSDSCRTRYAEPTIASWKEGQSIYRTIYPKAPVKA